MAKARLMADECVAGPLVVALRIAGWDIVRSADLEPGAPDTRVLQLAFELDRVLVTEDNDFGDLVVRFALPTRGIIRIALRSLMTGERATRLLAAMHALDALDALESDTDNVLVTIERDRTRVRRLPGTPFEPGGEIL